MVRNIGSLENIFTSCTTIYLPDRKRPMLPTILSDTLCSLQENQKRFACTLDVEFDMDANIILDSLVYKNTLISVHKNYRYEEENLLLKNQFMLNCLIYRVKWTEIFVQAMILYHIG